MGVGMHHIIGTMRALLCMVAATSTFAFCPHPRARTREELRDDHSRPSSLRLVTESDVISLVEKAEELWARVERLRNEANDLSARAESLGREAEISTDAATRLLRQQSISEEKIREANDAQNLSLDLGALLDRAVSATREADEIEVLAEEAIAASEAALEQYLIDFPEDDEIDTIL